MHEWENFSKNKTDYNEFKIDFKIDLFMNVQWTFMKVLELSDFNVMNVRSSI
jgi:hypothetical protein